MPLQKHGFTGNDCFTTTDLIKTLQDFNVYNLPRATRGGGVKVAVLARKGLQVKRNNYSIFLSFETSHPEKIGPQSVLGWALIYFYSIQLES